MIANLLPRPHEENNDVRWTTEAGTSDGGYTRMGRTALQVEWRAP